MKNYELRITNYVALLLACLTMSSAVADTRSTQIIERMGATIKGWKNYAVEFRLEASQQVEGRYVVGGERYYLQVEQTEVYCDGRTRWEVNNAYREVTIDRVDPKDKSILSNPTQVFDFPDAAFSHTFGGIERGGEAIVLTPKNSGNIQQIKLLVDPASGLPKAVEYRLDQASEPIRIEVVSIGPEANLPASRFIFDKAKYPGFEIIDFR